MPFGTALKGVVVDEIPLNIAELYLVSTLRLWSFQPSICLLLHMFVVHVHEDQSIQ